MKKNFLTVLSLISLSFSSVLFFSAKTTTTVDKVSAELVQSSFSSTMNIDLNETSVTNVRSYYSDLNSLDAAERKGSNLLKNLKPILRKNFKFYSYDNVWKIYEITDRDWDLSPASAINISNCTYNEDTKIISKYKFGGSETNPYVHAYYRDHESSDTEIIEDSKVQAWGDHTTTGINREHLWPQSHGFKTKTKNSAEGPAGTDVHHLVAADSWVNSTLHNNYAYGYVDTPVKVGNRPSTTNNKFGTPKTKENAQTTKVFEPQDQDKGDIARACFYMVAMYNNLGNETGVISDYDANLNLVMYATSDTNSEWSSDTVTVNLGNLADLLEWNRLDPPDEYEIHRNDLIYNNFQFNRNPFIDFPSWADIAFGSSSLSANPSSDSINSFDSEPTINEQFEALNTFASLQSTYEKSEPDPNEFTLVLSNDDLVSGATYLLCGTNKNNEWFSATKEDSVNNRKATSISVNNNSVIANESLLKFTLNYDDDNSGWTFITQNYGEDVTYFSATKTEKDNYLKVIDSPDAFSYFSIDINNGVASIVCTGKSSKNIMMYNSSNSLFSCYNSTSNFDSSIYLFKQDTPSYYPTKTNDKYNISLSFGTCISASLKQSIDELGSTTYGIAYKIGTAEEYTLKPITGAFTASAMAYDSVDETLSEAVANNHYYQFALSLNGIPEEDWGTVVTACGYVTIGDKTYYTQTKSYSVISIANDYITNHSDDEAVIAHNDMLTWLAGLGA